MKIVLLTAASDAFLELADLVEPNKKAWCERWGVEYKRIWLEPYFKVWDRAKLWLDTLETCDWMFWTGADTLITDMSRGPDRFVEDDKEFVFSVEQMGLQGDVLWFKNTQAVRDMLWWIHSAAGYECRNDEDALGRWAWQKQLKVRVLCQCDLQAFPPEPFYQNNTPYRHDESLYTWKHGDFLLHLHSLAMPERFRLLKQYMPLVKE